MTTNPTKLAFDMEQEIPIHRLQPAKINVYAYYEPSVCNKLNFSFCSVPFIMASKIKQKHKTKNRKIIQLPALLFCHPCLINVLYVNFRCAVANFTVLTMMQSPTSDFLIAKEKTIPFVRAQKADA